MALKPFQRKNLLSPDFYRQPTLQLAQNLLGKIFVRELGSMRLAGRIVETEGYHQDGDPSCHAHRGETKRNRVMFGEPGRLYVYFTYGMHYCLNIVSEPAGTGAAVLIRAVEPLEGVEAMYESRKKTTNPRNLTNGPAKFCQAFQITTEQNGLPLDNPPVYLLDGNAPPGEIVTTTRIGISSGADLPWRFYLKDSPWVSKKE